MNRYQIALKSKKAKRFYIENHRIGSDWPYDDLPGPSYKELWIMDRKTGIVKMTFSIFDKVNAQKWCRRMNRKIP